MNRQRRLALGALPALYLTACGGGGSSNEQTTPSGKAGYGDMSAASLGVGAALNGAIPFPADNAWNTDISQAPVDPNSARLIESIGLNTGLHPDFGAGLYNGSPIGIPYVVVAGTQPKVTMNWQLYGDESDPGPYPVPPDAPVEGAPNPNGDRHVLVIDRDNDRLYEIGNAFLQSNGSWNASGGAVFHLDSNNVRPGGQPTWTSADAAGLPISRAWPAMKKRPARPASAMPCVSRWSARAVRLCRPPVIGLQTMTRPTCRPWACA